MKHEIYCDSVTTKLLKVEAQGITSPSFYEPSFALDV